MKKKLQHIILTLLVIVTSLQTIAQTFPVQVIPQVTPPPPVYLTDYANANNSIDRVKATILLTDLTVTSRQVRLKLYIESNGIKAQSRDFVIGSQPIFLDGGVPVQLGSIDLAPYFELQNLQGISAGAYANTLPEGLYKFCFEVYDVISGNRISSKSCTNVLIFLNEPPFLNLPRNNINLEAINPQNILFQWTPRHINVSNVEYEFSLVEIWDYNMDPQAVFLASPPFYQTTTKATSLLYGVAEPQLLEGKRYAWRVRAMAIDGIDEIGLFSNDGYSEIFAFTYQGECAEPTYLSVEEVSTKTATFRWQGDIDNLNYRISYRKAVDEDGNTGLANTFEWFENDTTREEFVVIDLEPNTMYEWRVGGYCADGTLTFTESTTFTTMAEEAEAYYNCGIEPNIDIANQVLLETIQVGDVIKAGDFNVKIQEVEGTNSFTGKGYTTVGFLKNIKIALVFTNIQVNTDYQFVTGEIKTIYDPTWSNILDVDDVIDEFEDIVDVFIGDDHVDITLDFDIEASNINVDTDAGQIVITNPETGQTATYDYDSGDDYTITDESGDRFEIDGNGNVSQTGDGAEGGPATAANTFGITDNHNGTISDPSVSNIEKHPITFVYKKGDDTKYELDAANNDYENEKYHKVTIDGGGSYYPIHKAIVEGGAVDDFYIDVVNSSNYINTDSLIFKTVSGTKVPAEKVANTNTYKITVTGRNSYVNEEAIITYKDTDGKQHVLSSFFIHHIKKFPTIKVNVVLVNGASNVDGLQAKLDAIYKPTGVSFNVGSSVDSLTIAKADWDVDVSNNTIDYNGSGLASDHPIELRAIKNYYKNNNPSFDSKAYYLFVLDDSMPVTKALAGFMPKKNQWGFLFQAHSGDNIQQKENLSTIAAHELGHGIFALGHPFGEDETKHGNANTWLMGYSNGTELAYPNWARMSSNALQLYLFQDDSDNEIKVTSKELIKRLFNDIYCAKQKSQNTAKIYTKHKLTRNQTLAGDRNEKVWGVRILEVTFFHVITDLINIKLDFEETVLENASDGKDYKMVRFYDEGNKEFYIDIIPHQDDYTILVEKLKSNGSQFIIDEHNNQINKYNEIRNNDVEEVKQFLYSLSPCVLDNIPVKNRILIIEDIAKEWVVDSDVEELVIRLLEATYTKEDVNYFVKGTQNSEMWDALFNDIDSSENAELFAGQLVRIAKIFYENNPIKDKIVGAANFKTHNIKLLSDYKFIKNTSNVNIFEKEKKYHCAGIGAGWLYECGMEETILFKNRSIWDLVTVKFEQNNSYANIAANQKLKLIPIGLLVYFTEKQMTGALKQKFLTTLDIALLAVGVGEVNLAVKGIRAGGYTFSSLLRLSLGVADLSAMGMDIACNSANQSELCNDWKEISLYVNLGLISVSGLDQLANVITKTKQLDTAGDFTKIIDDLANAVDDLASLVKNFKGDIPTFYNSLVKAGYKAEKSENIVKIYAKNGIDILAEISENSVRLKYKGWGSDIVTKSDKTTTCIAKFDDQLDAPGSQFIKDELPEGAFGRGSSNKGGINILDVDDITYSRLKDEARDILESSNKAFTNDDVIREANEIFWNRYNLPFLEEAFNRGDDIRLLSDPTTLFGSTGFYQREIEVITQGWKKPDGTVVSSLITKYKYQFNELTKTYEKIK